MIEYLINVGESLKSSLPAVPKKARPRDGHMGVSNLAIIIKCKAPKNSHSRLALYYKPLFLATIASSYYTA